MQRLYFFILLLLPTFLFAQNEQLALNYIDSGEYEKAITILETSSQKNNQFYSDKLLFCYQQLKQYDKALSLIQNKKKTSNLPSLLVDEGYIYQLQSKQDLANKKYQEALNAINENANYAYNLGNVFEKKSLLEWALKSYELGQKVNPNLNFDYQVALLNGQLGDLNGMINKLLDYSFANQNNTVMVQNYMSRFLIETASDSFIDGLKKNLILRTQKSQDVYWNEFLSWFYVQQKEFGKAFIQEKAVFKREANNIENIIALGEMAVDNNQTDAAQSIYEFIIENNQDIGLQVYAYQALMKLKIAYAEEKDYATIKAELDKLITDFGINENTVDLQLLVAHFYCFNLGLPKEATNLLDQTLALNLNTRNSAKVKLELADILLYNEKFNQAILYYVQVEDNMKNDEMAHEASMKMAKANYYKNDFDWALQQVKVLKQSSSLLIANDALELFLLIQDNSVEDSLRLALKDFSKADFKLYQHKKREALQDFKTILAKHKGNSIEDETLYKIAKIEENFKNYNEALKNYNTIIESFSDSVLIDEALFFSAEIYRTIFNDNEKAKQLYEKIIFNHQDSIYFTEARRQYRILRGDTNI